MTKRGPFEVLGLERTASASEVQDRWRELRSKLHPDRGGDVAAFDEARKAFDQAFSVAVSCRACDGVGKIKKVLGLSELTMRCDKCRGTGRSQ